MLRLARRGSPCSAEHLERRERARPGRRREHHDRPQHRHRGIEERIPQSARTFQGIRRLRGRLRAGRRRRASSSSSRLQRALDDGDDIYAQLLGTAVSQDGHTDGITVPREEAQEAAIRTALRRAGVDPTEVGYVEAHGTGTPVGDPIEMRALASALTSDRQATNPFLIGSVKTNIGHLEAGAGVAGLIKAALVVKHGYIPANLHLQTPTRHVSLAELKIDVPATGRPFPDDERRIVGVNSFGFGGTNAHVVLAESTAPVRGPLRTTALRSRRPCCRSRRVARKRWSPRPVGWPTIWPAHPDVTLSELGYTLGQRRTHLTHRHTVIADSIAEAREQLQALADGGQIATGRVAAHGAQTRVRVYRHGPPVVEDVPRAAGRLLRVHRKHRAQRPRTVPLHGLVVARRAPAR